LLYYERQGGALVERAHVVGGNPLILPQPFDARVPLVPVDLIRLG